MYAVGWLGGRHHLSWVTEVDFPTRLKCGSVPSLVGCGLESNCRSYMLATQHLYPCTDKIGLYRLVERT